MVKDKMRRGLAVSDVIRSMLRQGYSECQAYEVLTGAGVRGEMVQLIMNKIISEFPGGHNRKPKLIEELEDIRVKLEELKVEFTLLRNLITT